MIDVWWNTLNTSGVLFIQFLYDDDIIDEKACTRCSTNKTKNDQTNEMKFSYDRTNQ